MLALHQVTIEGLHQVADLVATVKVCADHVMNVSMLVHLLNNALVLSGQGLYEFLNAALLFKQGRLTLFRFKLELFQVLGLTIKVPFSILELLNLNLQIRMLLL